MFLAGKRLLPAMSLFACGFFFLASPGAAQKVGVEIVKSFRGHTEPVYAVALTPDGKRLVTGSFDNSVKLWDVATGKELKEYAGKNGHTKMVLAVAVSPDGTLLASGGVDTSLKVWDIPSNVPIATFARDDAIRRLALSPTGKLLALAGANGKIIVVDPADFKESAKFEAAPSTSVAWTANSAYLASGAEDGRVSVFNIAKKETTTVGAHRGPVHQVVASPTGTFLSVGDDGALRVWTLPVTLPKTLPPSNASAVAATLGIDAQSLVIAGADKSLRLVNIVAAKEVKTFPGSTADIASIALSPAMNFLVAGQTDGKCSLWSVGDGKLVGQLAAHTGKINAVAFHPQQPQFATGGADGVATVWTTAAVGAKPAKDKKDDPSAPLVKLDAHPGGVTALSFAVTGQLVTAGADKTIKIWDLAKKADIKTFGPLPDAIAAVGVSKDGQMLIAAAGKTVRIWNMADGKELATLPHPAEVRDFVLKTDKTRLATAGADKQTRVWDLAAAKELQWNAFADAIQAVFMDAGGSAVVSVAGKTALMEPTYAQRVIVADAGPTYAIAVSNAGMAFTGGADKTIKAWNTTNGQQEKMTFPTLSGAIRALAITKTGQLLAAGGDDKIVRVYTLPDAKEVGSYPVEAPIRTLEISPNGQTLVVNTADKKVFALNLTFAAGQPPPPEFLKPVQVYTPAELLTDLAFTADNATFYAPAGKMVQLWKVASINPVKTFGNGSNVDSIIFHPKTPGLIATGGSDGKVRIFDLAKNALAKEIVAHTQKDKAIPVYTIAFSPDGTQILSSSYDHSLKLHDAVSGALIREFKPHNEKDFPKGHYEEVYSAAFSPDGKFIASGSGGLERVIKIWKTADGSVVRDLINPSLPGVSKESGPSHPGWILHLKFLSDGRLVSVGEAPKNRGYIAVWNIADGKLLQAEATNFGTLQGFALSPDAKTLAVGVGNRGPGPGDFNNAHILRVPGIN